MRIVIAMMKHETNTFSPIITDWQRFEEWGAYLGNDVVAAYGNTRMAVAAYIDLAREIGAEIVTPLAAEAMPSGRVLEAAYEHMCDLICDAIRDGADAALLDLHGAMVAEHLFDGEGELLERIRTIAPDLPIAVTCDLHCNLTEKMVSNCTALVGYKTYPHTDIYETAEQVGRIVLAAAAGESQPVMSWGNVPLMSQTLRQGTDDQPMKSLIDLCRTSESRDGVLAATVFGGFALADMPDSGTSVVVVANHDVQLADQIRDSLLGLAWRSRDDFVYQHQPLEEAVAHAKSIDDGPVILLDHADNCGSGANQDVMTVIAEVIRQELEGVVVAAVWDPKAVQEMQRAGVGAEIKIDLGGKTDMPSIGLAGKPLSIGGRVKALTDGQWIVRGPMYTGFTVNMGPSAVLDTGNMQIVVVSHHHEPWDLGVFTSVGIQPEFAHYILLKSRIHYRAGFGDLPKHTITLDGDGVTTSDNDVLDYEHVRRPIFPLDRINEP